MRAFLAGAATAILATIVEWNAWMRQVREDMDRTIPTHNALNGEEN